MKNIFFIVSSPRSGSTLLQHILSQSELICTANEPWFLLPHLRHINCVYNHPVDVEAKAIVSFLKSLDKDNYLRNYSDFLFSIYAKKLNEREVYFLDKTPRYYEFLPELVRLFPDAKIIVLQRNPVASLLSTIERWPKKFLFDYYYKHKDIIDSHLSISSFVKEEPKENVYQIKYEEITTNPEDSLSKLFNFLGIKWNTSYLSIRELDKVKGLLGDNKIYSTSRVIKKNEVPEIERINSKVIRKFVKGFCYYLTKNKYDLYDFSFLQPEVTPEFSRFVKFCSYMDNNNSYFSIKDNIESLKFSFYYRKYKI